MDSFTLKLAFDKVSGCKSCCSVQARQLNHPSKTFDCLKYTDFNEFIGAMRGAKIEIYRTCLTGAAACTS